MDRVSTSSIYSALVGNLLTSQQSEVTAANQVSSEKVATNLQGYGAQSETLTALQTVSSQNQNYLNQTDLVSAKLSTQDSAFTQINDAVSNATTAVSSALASGNGDTIIQSLQSAFGQVVAGLNSTYNGQYIFSGGQVNTPATSATQLSDLTSAPSLGSLFNNDQYVASNQIDHNTTLKTGFLASNIGSSIYSAFQSIEAYNQGPNGPLTGTLTTAQTTFLTTALASLKSAGQGVTSIQAQNGELQTEVTNTQNDLNDQSTTLQNLVGNITDANMAQATTNLQQAQLALQASAKVIASLQTDSLATLLPTG